MSLQIVRPATKEQFDQVLDLIQAFLQWHRRRHAGTTLTSDYYGNDEFQQELTYLADTYTRGRNRLLLAYYDRQPAGCVALGEIDGQSGEMKRMFVHEAHHGKGIGKALAQAIIQQAKELGYLNIKLNTSVQQIEALRLYTSLGFKKIAPYYIISKEMEERLVFMELSL